jgi:hypothetical protein
MHRDDNYYMDINCFHSMYYLSKPSSHRVFRIYTVAKTLRGKCRSQINLTLS